MQSPCPDKTLFQEARKLCTKGYTLCFDTVAILHNLYRANKECLTAQKKHGISNETMVMALYNEYFAEALLQRLICQSKIQWVLNNEVDIPLDTQLPILQTSLPGRKIAYLYKPTNIIQIYNIKTGEKLQSLRASQYDSVSYLLSLSNGILVSGHVNGNVIVWNTKTGEAKPYRNEHSRGAVASLVKMSKHQFASVNSLGVLKIWNLENRQVKTLTTKLIGSRVLARTREGHLAAYCYPSSTLFLIDTETDKLLKQISMPLGAMLSGLINLPNGNLASTSLYGDVYLWDIKTGHSLHTLKRGTTYFNSFAVTAGGFLASASIEGTIHIRNLETKQLQQILDAKDKGVYYLIAMEDGSLVSRCATTTQNLKHWVMQLQYPAQAFATPVPEAQ